MSFGTPPWRPTRGRICSSPDDGCWTTGRPTSLRGLTEAEGKMTGTCKLCGQTANLVESHVIPKALHTDTLRKDGLRIYSANLPYSKNSPIGEYDQFVCQYCENSFGPYDAYGVTFVRKYADGESGKPLVGDSFEHGFIADVDYKMLKLWILSMLWRADACAREFFDGINVGEQWRNTLTENVRCQSPGSDEYFAVAATLFDEDIFGREMLHPPVRTRYRDRNFYKLYVYHGFTFFIKVDRREQPSEWAEMTLRKDEPFPIMRRKFSLGEMKTLRKFA